MTTEQPLPTPGQADVTEALIALLRERQRKGIEVYGVSLQSWNGRDAGRDLLEELIDAAQYCLQLQMERADLERQLADLKAAAIAMMDALDDWGYFRLYWPQSNWPISQRLYTLAHGFPSRPGSERE